MNQPQIDQLTTTKASSMAMTLADALGDVISKKPCKMCGGAWVALRDPKHSDIERYGHNRSYHYEMVGGLLVLSDEDDEQCIPF